MITSPNVAIVVYDAGAGAPDDALRRALGDALGDALDQGADVVVWYERRIRALLSTPERWASRLGAGPEARHLGLGLTPEPVLRALQAVAGEDPFVTPTGDAGTRVSWLLAPTAGVAHATALRTMLAVDVTSRGTLEDRGASARWAYRAWQATQQGVMVLHDDGLAEDLIRGPSKQVFNPWSSRDLAWLIDQRWGTTHPWRVRLRHLATSRGKAVALAANLVPTLSAHPAGSQAANSDRDDGIDVIIPTLGRIDPLLDVLDDLATQTLLPERVIVVEQHGPNQTPPLVAPLAERHDPFTLVHRTTDQLGASRARNRALDDARAAWIALLDDDVRLKPSFLAAMLDEARRCGAHALNAGELGPDAKRPTTTDAPPRPAIPCTGIGSGRSLIARDALVAIGAFDETIEGWGEDQELGLRLNLAGGRVYQSRTLRLVHLHAPRGGFRADRSSLEPWANATPKPKPSPFILYRWLRWSAPAAQRGLFLAYLLGSLSGRGPLPWRLLRLPNLLRRWRQAHRWARTLIAGGPTYFSGAE